MIWTSERGREKSSSQHNTCFRKYIFNESKFLITDCEGSSSIGSSHRHSSRRSIHFCIKLVQTMKRDYDYDDDDDGVNVVKLLLRQSRFSHNDEVQNVCSDALTGTCTYCKQCCFLKQKFTQKLFSKCPILVVSPCEKKF